MAEFDRNPAEYSPWSDDGNFSAEEINRPASEYDRPSDGDEIQLQIGKSGSSRQQRRRSRFRSKLLLQAASVMAAAVLITSSFGVDLLGSNFLFGGSLSGNTLDNQLNHAGAQEGIITISMLWQSPDDMDLHVITPSGEEIFYGNSYAAGGMLDVDMQVNETVDNPVENIYFDQPARGTYQVFVHNFTDRTDGSTPILVRVKIRGQRAQEYRVSVDDLEDICTFVY